MMYIGCSEEANSRWYNDDSDCIAKYIADFGILWCEMLEKVYGFSSNNNV